MKKIITYFIAAYLFLFPLWMGDGGYTNIQTTKVELFWLAVRMFVMFCVLASCVAIPLNKGNLKQLINIDKKLLVLIVAFIVNMIVSWGLAGWDMSFVTGENGRQFGLIAWIAILIMFFVLSHFIEESNAIKISILIPLNIVSMIAYLNFLGFNVFNASVIDIKESLHISTIGNIDLVAGYICMMLAFVLGIYIFGNKYRKVYLGTFFIACCALISSNSDTGYLMLGFLFILFPFFIKNNSELIKYVNALVLLAGTGIFMKITQLLRGVNNCRRLYGLSYRHTYLPLCTVVLVACSILYVLIRLSKEKKAVIWFVRICDILGVVGIFTLVILVNFSPFGNILQDKIGVFARYLVLSDEWGTGRGVLWRCAAILFLKLPVWQKIFGAGVAGYYKASQLYLPNSAAEALWKDSKIVDPHNIFLQSLINFGIVGTILLIGILGYMLYLCLKGAKRNREYLCYVFVIIAYVTQGSVNYFHLFIEPIFFLLMAYGIGRVRDI